VLTVEEVERLLALPRLDRPCGLRDRAVLETFYATGLRLGEGVALDLGDVDFASGAVRIRYSKSGHGRLVPLGKRLADTLQRYLAESHPLLSHDAAERALFLSRFGTRFSRASVMMMVKRTAREAGLPSVHTHSLRHSVARHMLAAGADIQDIQQLLGHRGLHATHIYTGLGPEDVATEHRRTHPRAGPAARLPREPPR
jgi:integrase/recombinase XerD